MNKSTVLIVIDGLGLREQEQGNAFKLANTPVFDNLFKQYPNSIIQASGQYVGLPEGQMGNSEVGHLNIGAGTVVYTGLSLIKDALNKNKFKTNAKFIKAFDDVKKHDSTLHIMGLLSDGGVHSLQDHLWELLDSAYEHGIKKLSVHVFGDGRDVKPSSITPSMEKLKQKCDQYGYIIASIGGRFYAMDRDTMFERNEAMYNAMLGKSQEKFSCPLEYIKEQYDKGNSDEFFVPASNSNSNQFIKDNDSIIFFNFRPDRARQLTHMLIGSDLYDYSPLQRVKINTFVSMMKYEGIECDIAFDEMEVSMPIGKVIELEGKTQLRIAETQKYAHVTYFMDGGNDIEFKNSKRIMVDSLKVESYASAPQMSAKEITDKLLEFGTNYDLTIMNYANPDMVGHTGDLQAAIKAVEFLDKQIGRVWEWAKQNNVTLFITADHGNAEITQDEFNNPATKHTSSPVMLICNDQSIKLKDGKLANVAPTLLDYMNIKKPIQMDEETLLIR